MVRLTDRPDMTLNVYIGRKTTTQQQFNFSFMSCNLSSKSKMGILSGIFIFASHLDEKLLFKKKNLLL